MTIAPGQRIGENSDPADSKSIVLGLCSRVYYLQVLPDISGFGVYFNLGGRPAQKPLYIIVEPGGFIEVNSSLPPGIPINLR